MGSLNSGKEVLNRRRMYGNGYSMAIVLDHRSNATSLTGNEPLSLASHLDCVNFMISSSMFDVDGSSR